MRIAKLALAAAAFAAAPSVSSAGVLYQENFDTDPTDNWSFNSERAGDLAADGSRNEANYSFDYSTVGIPSAPRSAGGTTRGLKMEANIPGTGVFTGFSTSPIDKAFTGDFTVRADVWQNFNGPFPGGGNGSTQMTWAGVGTNGTTAQFPGTSVQGVGFAASGDGGTAQDYRVYTNIGAPLATATGAYAAGTQSTAQNNSDPYYAAKGFGGKTAPAGQSDLFPQQVGSTAAGTQGMGWHLWEITKVGNTVSWSIDGVPMGSADVTNEPFGGDNLFFGQFDINATSSTDPNARDLLFGLIDNVEVTDVVPEPGALSLLALGAVVTLRRRRRSRD
jgi:hypothetical protein